MFQICQYLVSVGSGHSFNSNGLISSKEDIGGLFEDFAVVIDCVLLENFGSDCSVVEEKRVGEL